MEKLEEGARKRRKKENIQRAVLAAAAITGTIAVGMLAPNIFLALPGIMGRKQYKLAFQARTAAARLAIKGHIRFVEKNGKKRIEITEAGRRAFALEQAKAFLATKRPKRVGIPLRLRGVGNASQGRYENRQRRPLCHRRDH